ncbi:hypothetical protein OEZ86_005136 [Tetradesmus obliquus]|nr:hypothetical protein OEZ86_005136 [Tetradesmus obliquus]
MAHIFIEILIRTHQGLTQRPVEPCNTKNFQVLIQVLNSHRRCAKMRASITVTLLACFALLGCVKADEATAANYRPRTPTAWSLITSNPALSQVAGIMQRLGLQPALSGPFSGTLLLPTNQAVEDYMAEVELLHQENGTFATPAIERRMWAPLLNYHQLPRAVSTRQKGMAVTLDTKHVDQDAALLARSNHLPATRTFNKPSGNGPFHKLRFLCSGAARAAAVTPDADPQTFKRCEVTSIRDEQNTTTRFVSKNTAVLGGGLIHTVNAVLQPNDVYPSLAALLTQDPELSVLAAVVQAVSNQSSCWDGPAGLRELDCCMCSPAAIGTLNATEAYLGEGMLCRNGEVLNFTSDRWQPYVEKVPGLYGNCSANGTFTCYEYDSFVGNYVACPCPEPTFSSAARVAADAAVTVAANQPNKAKCKEPGTCGWENLQGTFSLPTNQAFRALGETTNADGVPTNLDAAKWKPIVQFHFINAASDDDFVKYDGQFPRNNRRTTLLGARRRDTSARFQLTFQATGNRLTIGFQSPTRASSTVITKSSISMPPHIAHKVSTLMTPPCGDRCETS